MNLPSLAEIFAAGYKTRRVTVGITHCNGKPDFDVIAPDGTLLGRACSSTAVARLVVRHQIAALEMEAA